MSTVKPVSGCLETPGNTLRFSLRRPFVVTERILRIQGYHDFTRVRPAIVRAAAAMAAEAAELAAPQVAFRRRPILRLDGGSLALEDGPTLRSPAFAVTLCDCTEVAIFILGLGEALDKRVIALVEGGDLLEALLLETAGWLCVEDATRQFKSYLRDFAAAEGMRITSRMGPGYTYRIGSETCSWPLEQQPELFAAFGTDELPVRLSESNAMHPKMSRSGLFGLGRIQSASRAFPKSLESAIADAT
jgi:hypothetical protein